MSMDLVHALDWLVDVDGVFESADDLDVLAEDSRVASVMTGTSREGSRGATGWAAWVV